MTIPNKGLRWVVLSGVTPIIIVNNESVLLYVDQMVVQSEHFKQTFCKYNLLSWPGLCWRRWTQTLSGGVNLHPILYNFDQTLSFQLNAAPRIQPDYLTGFIRSFTVLIWIDKIHLAEVMCVLVCSILIWAVVLLSVLLFLDGQQHKPGVSAGLQLSAQFGSLVAFVCIAMASVFGRP